MGDESTKKLKRDKTRLKRLQAAEKKDKRNEQKQEHRRLQKL